MIWEKIREGKHDQNISYEKNNYFQGKKRKKKKTTQGCEGHCCSLKHTTFIQTYPSPLFQCYSSVTGSVGLTHSYLLVLHFKRVTETLAHMSFLKAAGSCDCTPEGVDWLLCKLAMQKICEDDISTLLPRKQICFLRVYESHRGYKSHRREKQRAKKCRCLDCRRKLRGDK